jgi:hypothetical protein
MHAVVGQLQVVASLDRDRSTSQLASAGRAAIFFPHSSRHKSPNYESQ